MPLTKPKVTILALKRCKTCVFWSVYNGNIDNDVMRKLHGVTAPARKTHACQLILRTEVDADGEAKEVSVYPQHLVEKTDRAGPRFGRRCGPKDGCGHHRAKKPTYVKPPPKIEQAKTHDFIPGVSPAVSNPMHVPSEASFTPVSVINNPV